MSHRNSREHLLSRHELQAAIPSLETDSEAFGLRPFRPESSDAPLPLMDVSRTIRPAASTTLSEKSVGIRPMTMTIVARPTASRPPTMPASHPDLSTRLEVGMHPAKPDHAENPWNGARLLNGHFNPRVNHEDQSSDRRARHHTIGTRLHNQISQAVIDMKLNQPMIRRRTRSGPRIVNWLNWKSRKLAITISDEANNPHDTWTVPDP